MGGSSSQTIGYWYHLATHHGLCKGPIDAFIEYRGGTKVAWKGALTASGVIQIDKPELWGGEKDQGGIVGPLRLMFGEAGQMPNSYLTGVFGNQTAAWRGMTTVAFEGGKYGAMNPYPQKPSYRVRAITKQWDDGACWYEAKAPITLQAGSGYGAEDPFAASVVSFWVPIGSGGNVLDEKAIFWGYPSEAERPAIVAGPALKFDREATEYGQAMFLASATGGAGPVMFPEVLYDLTIDGYVTFDSVTGTQTIVQLSAAFPDFVVQMHLGQWRLFSNASGETSIGPGGSAVTGTSYHVQLKREGTLWSLEINGVSIGTTTVISEMGDRSLYYGRSHTRLYPLDGQLRLWRVTAAARPSGVPVESAGRYCMNSAHMLVFAHTQQETGREPIETVNSASAMAAADWFYAQGFGLCTTRRPEAESPAEFRRRIEKVAACSFSRSLADGLWYIDIANGIYDLASLPILTDDDVLDFKEVPTVLDDAINSVSVKYFDPERKESIITPPVRALGLVSEFGEIHQTYDYPEIPTGSIAVRVAQRELLSSCTPTRAFDLATTRTPYGWRQNTYFRLQLPKRGIADMVCLVGDLQHGQLKSGAIKLQAVQDIYSLPSTVYTEVEHGVDSRPDQTPVPIIEHRAIEAPYVDVVAALTRADMAVLPPEVGFLVGIAADPADSIGFTMQVAPSGGAYVDAAYGDFCPTALVSAAADKVIENFTITAGVRLAEVLVGAPVLWDEELCVVKALDVVAGTISLGRGCADTVAWEHAAGSRLLFYGDDAASDPTEYTDGETVNVKLLTKTGSERLDAALATPMAVTFDQRQFRAYPPAAMTINAAAWPAYAFGVLSIAAAHRDRLLQANMLVDQSMATIGPEAATTYTIRYYAAGVLEHTAAGITAFPSTYTPVADCLLRVELEAMRDSLASWQAQVHEFAYYLADPNPITDETGSLLLDEAGDFIY